MDNTPEYLDLIEETGNFGYWQLTIGDGDVFWSPGVYRIHGVSPTDFTPNLENTVLFYHPDDRQAVVGALENALKKKKGDSFNLRIIRSDETIRYVRSTFKCKLNDNNDVIGLFGIFQDMTEQIQKTQETEEAHNFLNTVIDYVPDLIFVKDRQSNLVLGNKAFWALYDQTPEQLMGTTALEHFPKDEAAAFIERDQRVFTIGEDETEEDITNSKGITRAYTTKKIAFTRRNNQQYLLGVARDITQRRLYEEQIKEYSTQLEMRNINLERSNQALEEFAHTAAHDLKEPIRSIHSYVEMILYDHPDLSEAIKDPLKKVMSVSWRMGQMVSELLLLSEISHITGEFVETDLNQVLIKEMDGLQMRLEQANATVNHEHLPTIVCHPTRIGEILRNLIVNGIKYNESDEKTIDIGFFEDGNKTVFFVKDNGIGIKDDHQGKIFKIFKRLHGKTEYGGGTGIGLAITKKIVEMHNGRIWVESKKDQGTTFFFTLS